MPILPVRVRLDREPQDLHLSSRRLAIPGAGGSANGLLTTDGNQRTVAPGTDLARRQGDNLASWQIPPGHGCAINHPEPKTCPPGHGITLNQSKPEIHPPCSYAGLAGFGCGLGGYRVIIPNFTFPFRFSAVRLSLFTLRVFGVKIGAG